ncbi:MAG: hypothetical protein ABR998_07465 [Gemmatimonadales bacterium]
MTHTARRVLFSITLAILGGLALLGAHALFVLRVIVFGRYWLVSATEAMQVLCGWRVKARR